MVPRGKLLPLYSVSVSSNGRMVAVGAPRNSDNGKTSSGKVLVYSLDEFNTVDTWVQIGQDLMMGCERTRSVGRKAENDRCSYPVHPVYRC